MTLQLAGIADEAYVRINCYGIGAWLENLFQKLGQALPSLPEPWEQRDSMRTEGLVFTIYRHPGLGPPPDALVLAKMEGDASAPMPRGLSAARETPQSAASKLSAATEGGSPERLAEGDMRITYFMPDGNVVELRFNRDLVGFDRIVIAGLGAASAFHAAR